MSREVLERDVLTGGGWVWSQRIEISWSQAGSFCSMLGLGKERTAHWTAERPPVLRRSETPDPPLLV